MKKGRKEGITLEQSRLKKIREILELLDLDQLAKVSEIVAELQRDKINENVKIYEEKLQKMKTMYSDLKMSGVVTVRLPREKHIK